MRGLGQEVFRTEQPCIPPHWCAQRCMVQNPFQRLYRVTLQRIDARRGLLMQ